MTRADLLSAGAAKQSAVLAAVEAGARSLPEIERATGLSRWDVGNCVRLLRDKGKLEAVGKGKRDAIRPAACELARAWG